MTQEFNDIIEGFFKEVSNYGGKKHSDISDIIPNHPNLTIYKLPARLVKLPLPKAVTFPVPSTNGFSSKKGTIQPVAFFLYKGRILTVPKAEKLFEFIFLLSRKHGNAIYSTAYHC